MATLSLRDEGYRANFVLLRIAIRWCLEDSFNVQTQSGRSHLNAVPRQRHFVTAIVGFLEVNTEFVLLNSPFADLFRSI